MNSQTSSRWVVDAALFAVFVFAFFLDLTGLDLHQWIGVAAAGLALYHLVTHWNWVTAVTRRFFGKTSGRSRLYYALDVALLAGFAAIAATGLVISTWLDLPLDNYDIWLTVHIGASIGTLAVTALKLALHWRWIVTAGKGIFGGPAMLPPSRPRAFAPAVAARPSAARPINRRAFLGVMGAIGVPSALALTQAARALQLPADGTSAEDGFEPLVTFVTDAPQTLPEEQAENTRKDASQMATATPAALDALATPAPSPSPLAVSGVADATATAIAAPTATASAPAVSCVIRCRKGCSFPGRCRKYVDNNGNNRCDLGECL